jgi:polypeptide N-acetylgalactosaminyltransferase
LKCHNFKWYLDNVYPEKFILDENVYAFGQVYNKENSIAYCMDTLGQQETANIAIGIYMCHVNISTTQFFSYSHNEEFRRENLCAISAGKTDEKLYFERCNGNENQKWIHDKYGHIKNKKTGLCIDRINTIINNHIKINECSNKIGQHWTFTNYVGILPLS